MPISFIFSIGGRAGAKNVIFLHRWAGLIAVGPLALGYLGEYPVDAVMHHFAEGVIAAARQPLLRCRNCGGQTNPAVCELNAQKQARYCYARLSATKPHHWEAGCRIRVAGNEQRRVVQAVIDANE